MKRTICTLISLCLYLGGFAQQSRIEQVLVKEFGESGTFETYKESLFIGEEARNFNWRDYKSKDVQIIIRREKVEKIPVDDLDKVGLHSMTSSSLLHKAHHIYSINEAGDKRYYSKREPEQKASELSDSYLFVLDLERSTYGLPNLDIGFWEEKNPEVFTLSWFDRGECPDSYTETELPEGEIRISLQDEKNRTIFQRNIITTSINIKDGQEFRMVDIEDIKYTHL